MSVNVEWPSDIAVCIPAYKSSHHLQRFLPLLLMSVPEKNILVVDDGSGDDTDTVCFANNVQCTTHPNNMGKGAALKTGFALLTATGMKWILTLDADGQHAIEDLPLFLEAIKKDPESGIIIGKRNMQIGVMPIARIFSNRVTSWILGRYTSQTILDSQCGYRAYNTTLLQRLSIEFNRFEMESEVILKAAHLKFPISFVQVQTLYLDHSSHISHFLDTMRWVKAVLNVHKKLKSQSAKKSSPKKWL